MSAMSYIEWGVTQTPAGQHESLGHLDLPLRQMLTLYQHLTVTVIVLQVTRGPFTLKSLYVMKYIVWPMLMIDDEVVSQATRKMFEFQ